MLSSQRVRLKDQPSCKAMAFCLPASIQYLLLVFGRPRPPVWGIGLDINLHSKLRRFCSDSRPRLDEDSYSAETIASVLSSMIKCQIWSHTSGVVK